MIDDPALNPGQRLVRLGTASWRLLGLVAVVALVALAIGALAGVVIAPGQPAQLSVDRVAMSHRPAASQEWRT